MDFSAHVTLKFDGWPQKRIGHPFFTTSSFVHHYKSISELKPELQQTPQKLLGFYRTEEEFWPDFTDIKHDYTQEFNWSYSFFISKCPRTGKFRDVCYSPETLNWGQNWRFFCPVWPWNLMDDLKNNRAPVLYYVEFVHNFKAIGEFKFASQSVDAQVESKLVIFCPMWPWNLMDDLEKQ